MAAAPPDQAQLLEAALNHLARYAASEAGMERVLARRLDRWARTNTPPDCNSAEIAAAVRRAKTAIPAVIARLKELGALNDVAFAASRANRLSREGKSRRATLAHLAAKGIRTPNLDHDPNRELAAACAYLRRRRAGPFGAAPELKIMGAMARGGFSQDVARRALRLSRDEAEALIKLLHE